MKKCLSLLLVLTLLLAVVPMAAAEEKVTVRMNTCIVFSDLRDREAVEQKLDEMLASKGYNFKILTILKGTALNFLKRLSHVT